MALPTVENAVPMMSVSSVMLATNSKAISASLATSPLVTFVLQVKLVPNVQLDFFWFLKHVSLVAILAKHAEHLTSNAAHVSSPSN